VSSSIKSALRTGQYCERVFETMGEPFDHIAGRLEAHSGVHDN
jgi:hypothetical protein